MQYIIVGISGQKPIVSNGCWHIYSFAPMFSEEYMDTKDIYSNWKWHINIVRSGSIFLNAPEMSYSIIAFGFISMCLGVHLWSALEKLFSC